MYFTAIYFPSWEMIKQENPSLFCVSWNIVENSFTSLCKRCKNQNLYNELQGSNIKERWVHNVLEIDESRLRIRNCSKPPSHRSGWHVRMRRHSFEILDHRQMAPKMIRKNRPQFHLFLHTTSFKMCRNAFGSLWTVKVKSSGWQERRITDSRDLRKKV